MNPANYRLSKEIIQEMIDEENRKENHPYESLHDRFEKGQSYYDLVDQALDELQNVYLSEPLKKVHTEMLQNVIKNCYQEKYMSEESPNIEKIMECR